MGGDLLSGEDIVVSVLLSLYAAKRGLTQASVDGLGRPKATTGFSPQE
jgi:hypothetical protein